MITFHATAKKCHGKYVAMVTLRNTKGQCVGSRTGTDRFDTHEQARAVAYLRAIHCVASLPRIYRACVQVNP